MSKKIDKKDLEEKMREFAEGLNFSKLLAELINDRLKAGKKIKIKSELKDIFLRAGFCEESAIRFSKMTFLYNISKGYIENIPIKKEKTQVSAQLVNKFISDMVEHEVPVMLIVRLLFGKIEYFGNRFFVIADGFEADKVNLEVS